MSFCTKCGVAQDAGSKFCKNCGAPLAEAVNAQDQVSAVPVTTYSQPIYGEPVVSGKTKALAFVGMGLSIGGIFFAVIGLLYTFAFMMIDGALAFGYSIGLSIFSMPLSIVGGILCGKSSAQGNRSAVCSVGSKLRVAGIIVSAVMLFFGIVALTM